MNIKKFLDENVRDYATYSTMRGLVSWNDGLKNSTRKIICTFLKRNMKDKVSILAGIVSTDTEYLHGQVSLEGGICGLTQNYTGTNNLPLFKGDGNFGNRLLPKPSASRYIKVSPQPYLKFLFKKEDEDVLEGQVFEGTQIEPVYYAPTLPIHIINGGNGLATGFAQNILPRDINEVVKYIEVKINGKGRLPKLRPYYNGFKGEILDGESEGKFEIVGKVEKSGRGEVTISELPVGVDLQKYLDILNKLEDSKKIKSFEDKSEDPNFLFKVKIAESEILKGKDYLIDILKLRNKVSENYSLVDSQNKIIVKDNIYGVIDYFIGEKIKVLKLRKEDMLVKMNEQLLNDYSKYLFIKGIIDGSIIVAKKTRDQIAKQLDKNKDILTRDGNYDYLTNIPIVSLTVEKLKVLVEKIKQQKEDIKELKKKTVEALWLDDIKDLMQEIKKGIKKQ